MKREIIAHEVECMVDFDYSPPCRGARERSSGIQLEPDEPENVEINSISIVGQNITSIVTEEFFEAVCLEVLHELAEEAQADADDYGDYLYECRKDREMDEEYERSKK